MTDTHADPSTPTSPPVVVGIGASAGSFQPLRALLAAFGPEDAIALVVLLHQGAESQGLAVELLGASSRMRVIAAPPRIETFEPGVILVVPPGMSLAADGDALTLRRLATAAHPIDSLFRGLAAMAGRRAAAVVLSGTGSDGAEGLRDLVEAGGIGLAQRPDTAEFDAMPRAAEATGAVSHSVPVEAMPELLRDWARGSAQWDTPPSQRVQALRRLLKIVEARHGFDFSGYKPAMLWRRIARRMELAGAAEVDDYAAQLEQRPDEVEALFGDLLIGVTEFFRDAEAWDALQREIVDPLVARLGDQPSIRVWVVGTSTGEEAYSVAMVFLDAMARANSHCQLQIFATDADPQALAVARQGVYPAAIAAQVGPERMARYFVPVEDGRRVQVAAALRRCLIFGVQNVVTDPPFTGMDLVTCRNLLIYLSPTIQQRVLSTLHFALKPGAHLFLGKAETATSPEGLFESVSGRSRIFRRVGPDHHMSTSFRIASPLPGRPMPGFRAMMSVMQQSQNVQIAQRTIIDRFGPACVLITADHETVYFSGPTDRYLAQPHGAPTHDLLALAREGLRSRLRAAIADAVANGHEVRVGHVHVKRGDGYAELQITIVPVRSDGPAAHYLVVFEDEPPPAGGRSGGAPPDDAVLRNLELELAATKDDLRVTIDGLETSNEELRLANEEVVAVNEELQTRNEELQSSKEELQSLNEELSAVNQQLQVKLGELETANDDLRNVLASSEIATLRIDRDERIQWFSPAAAALLDLLPADTGRGIAVFSSPLLGPALIAQMREVGASGVPLQREVVSADGRWYLRRITPYRGEGKRTDGIMITLTEITEAKVAEQARDRSVQVQAQRLESLVDARTRQLRTLSFELTRAEESERQAIAADLHDDLLQLLLAARLKLGALQLAPSIAPAALQDVVDIVTRASQSTRSLAHQLAPAALTEQGLGGAIESLIVDLRKTHQLEVELEDDGEPKPIEDLTATILFRVVRELMVNVAKHAGTGRARVTMRRLGDERIEIRVSDQGRGFDLPALETSRQRGFGLRSARERLGFIGGGLLIDSDPASGSTVTLTAPLRRGNDPVPAADPPPTTGA